MYTWTPTPTYSIKTTLGYGGVWLCWHSKALGVENSLKLFFTKIHLGMWALTGSVCVCVFVCLRVCVCVLGHTMRCRCGLNLHTCILFMEAKTHSRQSRVCTAEGKLWNTVTYSVYSWLGRISKYARTNGKATWPPLADFVCSVCSTTLRSFQSKQFLCGNHFILPVRELLFTKLNHLEGNTTLNICIACTMHHSISQSKFITVYVRQKENQSFLRVVSNSYMLLLLTPSMIIWSLYLHPYEI